MGEKTEKATPKKLRDARKKGQVAKSQDFPSAFTFVVSIAAMMSMAQYLLDILGGFFVSIYTSIPDLKFETMAGSIMYEAGMVILKASLPVLVFTALIGVLVNFLIIGPVLSFEVFKPDIKKFDPIKNLKNKFKMKTLVELLKSIFKITVAGYLIYSVMWDRIPEIIGTVRLPLEAVALVFASFLTEVLLKVGIFFVAVAVFDLWYQKKTFAEEMKMEKHEVKQEHKNTEGDPIIKGKRKEIAREIAYSAGPEARVHMAQAVVTNPIHIAVAIGYNAKIDPAPHLLAMGTGHDASLIVKEAERCHVPVLRNIPLAHQLYDEGKINTYVPMETYEAIAEILRWIASLEGNEGNADDDFFETGGETDVEDVESDV